MTEEFIARIEGHGNICVDWDRIRVKMRIFEGERLFEGILVGRTAEEMIWITPRICGICPVAHNLASVNAVENAFGIVPGKTAFLLRELLQCGQLIQSHVLHLFFLALPDYLDIDRGTELAKKNPRAFKKALALKGASDLIVKTVGGRSVHPVTSTIGGFNKAPSQSALKKLSDELKATERAARWTADFCADIKYPRLKVDLMLVALAGDSIISTFSLDIGKRRKSLVSDYKEDIEEEVRDYSSAKFSAYRGKAHMVGALARLAIYGNYDKNRYNLDFANPFHNNIAQGIEVLLYHRKAQEIVEQLKGKKLDLAIEKTIGRPPLKGIGTSEAPRGGLYHEVHLKKKKTGSQRIINYANIVTPTAQNLMSLERSAQTLINQSRRRSRKELEKLLIMLVRAYDPCISCSAH